MPNKFGQAYKNELLAYLPQHLQKALEKDVSDADLSNIYAHLSILRKRMSAYLPNYLSAMIENNPVVGECSILIKNGCLVFADVSGFTAMSEKLSALGKEGAEEITRIVNNYFERMIDISLKYGGDLIKFGGDALILFYTGENSSLRGVQSAIAMQEAMADFQEVQTSQGVSVLKMSIGIASGLVYMIGMGTEEKMDYLAAGKTLERMDKAESISQAEQIVIDTETHTQVKHQCSYFKLEPGFWLINELKAEVPLEFESLRVLSIKPKDNIQKELNILQALKPYLPTALVDHLAVSQSEDTYQGAHRPVSVLFAHFYGVDTLIAEIGESKPEVILEVIDTYYRNMAQVIEQFGGTISRVDSYKSGQRILALFGALRAHENDHQRAVQTAWEMNNRLEDVNTTIQEFLQQETDLTVTLGHRIGINSGFVFASDVGASFRREYTVMGDQVNLTARLMSAAEPGEILIGETTADRLPANFILREKSPIVVKGKSKPVISFTLLDIEEEVSSLSESIIPLFGREIEVSIGRESVDEAKQGTVKTLVYHGDSGVGKTRLAQEIIAYASSNNFTALSANFQSFGKSMPYHAWIKIFNQIFELGASNKLVETSKEEQIKNLLGEIQAEEWAPLFGSIMGLDIPDNQITRMLDLKVRKQKIFDLTIQLLSHQAEKTPLILFLDDIQWADPVSLELIVHLVNHISQKPILLLIAHRTDENMPVWAKFSGVAEIDLHELPDYACIQLSKHMVGGISLPNQILEFILQKSSGNPLFILEIMRSLQTKGLFAKDDLGFWQISETLEDIEMPDTIHELVLSRVDRLPIESRHILQLASIIGVDFSLSFLNEAFKLRQTKQAIKSRLDHLMNIGVIEIHDFESNTFRFHHLTTREVVYNTLPYQERRQMHNQCGLYLEDHHDLAAGERIDLMAYHFFEGRAWDKAINYNLQAGKRAKNIYANESAIDSYQQVLEAVSAGKNGKQYQVEFCSAKESLGDVFTLVGRYEEALENFKYSLDKMCPEVEEREFRIHGADLSRKIADVFERQSEYDDAFIWINKGLDQVDPSTPSLERARLYLLGAGLYHRKGDNEQAASWCDLSIADSEVLSSDEAIQAQAQALYLRGAIELRNGNLAEAVEFCEKSKKLYQEIQDILGEARAWNNMGIALTDMGDWNKATLALEKSLEINQQIGNIHEEGFGANNLGNIYLYKGDWDKALRLFRQSNQIWKQIGAALPDAVTLSNQAQAHIYLNNWVEAECLLEEANRIFEQVGSDDFTPELERRWGELKFKIGDITGAKRHLSSSLEIAQLNNVQSEIAMTSRIMGEILLEEEDFNTSEAILEESLRTLIEIRSDYESARTRVTIARLKIQQGKHEEAKSFLETSINTFKRSGAKADLQKAKKLLAQLPSK